ncbi:hypothetical protein P8452_68776 [Trifolium repens]|nr:hypothetical protein P8452_68776 [Trifolium repens]
MHIYKGQTRLSNFAIPKRYELHLIPNFSSCTFSGIVQINLTINENTNSIVLNSLELVIQNTWFINSYGKYNPCDVVVDDEDEILVLLFDEALCVGEGILVPSIFEIYCEFYNLSSDMPEKLESVYVKVGCFKSKKMTYCLCRRLGWDSISGEDHSNSLLRGEIFEALATFGHDKTQQEARRCFQILLNDRNTSLLSANTRKAAYIAVMRSCIASSADPNVVLEVLNLLLSDEIPDQDVIYVLRGISLEGSGTAVKWLKVNWERILAKYGGGLLLTNFISQIVPLVKSNDEEADDIEAFCASRMNPSIIMNLNLSIEKIRIKARWIESVKQEHSLPNLIKQLIPRK